MKLQWSKVKETLADKSPLILTIAGGIGTGVTAYLCAKNTLKADVILAESEDYTKKQMALKLGKIYAPTAISFLLTLACQIGAYVTGEKQRASLEAAYILLAEYIRNYEQQVEKIVGPERNDEIKEIAMVQSEETAENGLKKRRYKFEVWDYTTSTKKLIYSVIFEATELDIWIAKYNINESFAQRCWASVNEFLGYFNIDYNPLLEDYGWGMEDCLYWISFRGDTDEENYTVGVDEQGEYILLTALFPPQAINDEYRASVDNYMLDII